MAGGACVAYMGYDFAPSDGPALRVGQVVDVQQAETGGWALVSATKGSLVWVPTDFIKYQFDDPALVPNPEYATGQDARGDAQPSDPVYNTAVDYARERLTTLSSLQARANAYDRPPSVAGAPVYAEIPAADDVIYEEVAEVVAAAAAAQQHAPAPPLATESEAPEAAFGEVVEWLRSVGLEQYAGVVTAVPRFQTIDGCGTMDEDDVLNEFCVTEPADVAAFVSAASDLRRRLAVVPPEEIVGVGGVDGAPQRVVYANLPSALGAAGGAGDGEGAAPPPPLPPLRAGMTPLASAADGAGGAADQATVTPATEAVVYENTRVDGPGAGAVARRPADGTGGADSRPVSTVLGKNFTRSVSTQQRTRKHMVTHPMLATVEEPIAEDRHGSIVSTASQWRTDSVSSEPDDGPTDEALVIRSSAPFDDDPYGTDVDDSGGGGDDTFGQHDGDVAGVPSEAPAGPPAADAAGAPPRPVARPRAKGPRQPPPSAGDGIVRRSKERASVQAIRISGINADRGAIEAALKAGPKLLPGAGPRAGAPPAKPPPSAPPKRAPPVRPSQQAEEKRAELEKQILIEQRVLDGAKKVLEAFALKGRGKVPKKGKDGDAYKRAQLMATDALRRLEALRNAFRKLA